VTSRRERQIKKRLQDAFQPTEFMLRDQSHLHAGHDGAREGKGHFDVMIVSEAFDGKSRIERHRMVYDALGTLVQSDIHALRIRAETPSERQSSTN
jgi:BolA protein